jgi:3,4-dihydroxyphenylacetate 2,3-dioxygenase
MLGRGRDGGVLGRRDYTGHGEQLCEYFPSAGTGQVTVDFTVDVH